MEIAQALLGEGGFDPGTKDLRVDRFGQVVGRSQLDAAHDTVQLINAGDDDDRDLPQRFVGLHDGQRLVAVQHRHHDVEQHDIDRICSQVAKPLEGILSVHGFDRVVTDRRQQPDEEATIE